MLRGRNAWSISFGNSLLLLLDRAAIRHSEAVEEHAVEIGVELLCLPTRSNGSVCRRRRLRFHKSLPHIRINSCLSRICESVLQPVVLELKPAPDDCCFSARPLDGAERRLLYMGLLTEETVPKGT